MSRPRHDVGEVFRRYGEAFLEAFGASTSLAQHRVMQAVAACRTSALGGHVDACDTCDHLVVSYNSCRNRHCPKCQLSGSAEWLDARSADLLPVPYYHVVFTLPRELAPLALQNKKVVYDILFKAASETLLTIAADPKHLGAQLGFLGILHTWGQNLLHHPHVHFVVPGGGLAPDRSRWVACRHTRFFLHVRVLSALFRRKFLSLIEEAFRCGQLGFHGDLAHLEAPAAFRALLSTLRNKRWVVHAKPPFGGPEQVLKYLARYTHRVAIANNRLVSIDNGQVTFRWKDYANGDRPRTMTLAAPEFIRRFLLHVLPKRFVRIRYFGFLANCVRRARLQLCRRLLGAPEAPSADPSTDSTPSDPLPDAPAEPRAPLCPACRKGRLLFLRQLAPFETFVSSPTPHPPDT